MNDQDNMTSVAQSRSVDGQPIDARRLCRPQKSPVQRNERHLHPHGE